MPYLPPRFFKRREFLAGTGTVLAASAGLVSGAAALRTATDDPHEPHKNPTGEGAPPDEDGGPSRAFNGPYRGDHLNQIAFPMGGMGAGMICLEGTGALSKFSLHHRPDLANEPLVFAALAIKGPRKVSRVLEGPVPKWKLRPQFLGEAGWPVNCWGLPRFRHVEFNARFPFATVHLRDEEVPLEVQLTRWSPFSPGDADSASLPVAGLEYRFINKADSPVDAIFSFNAANFMADAADLANLNPDQNHSDRIRATPGGFILHGAGAKDRPWDSGDCAIWVDEPSAKINHVWFRAGDLITKSIRMIWNDIESGSCYARDPLPDAASPGASLFAPFTVAPGEQRTITVHFAWRVPKSNLSKPTTRYKNGQMVPRESPRETYQPWYAGRYAHIDELVSYWGNQYRALKEITEKFCRTFYDSTLPPELLEALAANLTILKSPTVLRQTDGSLWGFEGCSETVGLADAGTDGVWNYAQAIAHLFPDLERRLRDIEFGVNQNEAGQQYSGAALPISPIDAAAEGQPSTLSDAQLCGVIKVFRDWRISGDTAWLRRLWPRVRASLDYCIKTGDPERRGWIEEPHSCTYDTILWGPDSMCTSTYLGALKAATLIGKALNEPVEDYTRLLTKGIRRMEEDLYNGEYFFQRTQWKNLRAAFPPKDTKDVFAQITFFDSPEGRELSSREGPTGQWGAGCLADGLFGAWLCLVSGVGTIFDPDKVQSHVTAVYRHNFKVDLTDNVNMFRASFACGSEAGLLLCTWPRGGRPSLPSNDVQEVWTGIEYEVASHLIAMEKMEEGLDIVRACRRRYDGRVRNPFDEVEWGHWYCRALSSYALLQAFSGARFDAVDKVLYLRPAIKGDFRCFLSTATGYGTVGVKNGRPFVEVASGEIPYTKIEFTARA